MQPTGVRYLAGVLVSGAPIGWATASLAVTTNFLLLHNADVNVCTVKLGYGDTVMPATNRRGSGLTEPAEHDNVGVVEAGAGNGKLLAVSRPGVGRHGGGFGVEVRQLDWSATR